MKNNYMPYLSQIIKSDRFFRPFVIYEQDMCIVLLKVSSHDVSLFDISIV